MAVSIVRDVKKATPSRGLSQLIDQAGELNAQAKAYEEAYNKLRKEIALKMPMGNSDVINEFGTDYEAKHFYPTEKRIDPEELFKLNKSLFFRVVKVSLQDAEANLSAEAFHKLLKVKTADAPRLTITKIKRKSAA